jgi:hypothetical protein
MDPELRSLHLRMTGKKRVHSVDELTDLIMTFVVPAPSSRAKKKTT